MALHTCLRLGIDGAADFIGARGVRDLAQLVEDADVLDAGMPAQRLDQLAHAVALVDLHVLVEAEQHSFSDVLRAVHGFAQ